jgi:hypothetical protein
MNIFMLIVRIICSLTSLSMIFLYIGLSFQNFDQSTLSHVLKRSLEI